MCSTVGIQVLIAVIELPRVPLCFCNGYHVFLGIFSNVSGYLVDLQVLFNVWNKSCSLSLRVSIFGILLLKPLLLLSIAQFWWDSLLVCLENASKSSENLTNRTINC